MPAGAISALGAAIQPGPVLGMALQLALGMALGAGATGAGSERRHPGLGQPHGQDCVAGISSTETAAHGHSYLGMASNELCLVAFSQP